MTNNKQIHRNGPAILAGISRRNLLGPLAALMTAAVIHGTVAQEFTNSSQTSATSLNVGDVVYTDSGNAIEGGFVMKVDWQTGQESVISKGGYLGFFGFPNGVAVGRDGQLIVANEACVLRINPATGQQTLIRDARGAAGLFWSVAVDRNGDVLVAAEKEILRVDAVTGETHTVSSHGHLTTVLSIAVGANNAELFVTNVRYEAAVGWVGEIIRVNPHNGRQTVISQGGYLTFLLGIAVNGDDIYVTGLKTHDDNFGVGRVTRVHARTGVQAVVAEGGYLVRPVGIAVDAKGQLIVADPYTINSESPDLYDGGLIKIDPATGKQTLIVRGHGSVVNPSGIAVVPDSKSGH